MLLRAPSFLFLLLVFVLLRLRVRTCSPGLCPGTLGFPRGRVHLALRASLLLRLWPEFIAPSAGGAVVLAARRSFGPLALPGRTAAVPLVVVRNVVRLERQIGWNLEKTARCSQGRGGGARSSGQARPGTPPPPRKKQFVWFLNQERISAAPP